HLYKNRAAIEIPLQIRPVSDTVIEANYKKNKFPKGDYWFLEDAMNHLCKFGLLNHWKPKKGFFEVVVVCDFGEIQEAKIIHLKNKAA
ncbi:MAG: hypothetical protein ACPG5P_04630, partial [Saprospiraceae bacterium]